jgi:hypothetical protein
MRRRKGVCVCFCLEGMGRGGYSEIGVGGFETGPVEGGVAGC